MEELHSAVPKECLGGTTVRHKCMLSPRKHMGKIPIKKKLKAMLEEKQNANQKGPLLGGRNIRNGTRTNSADSKKFEELLGSYRTRSARGRVEGSQCKGISPGAGKQRPSSSHQASDKHQLLGGPKWGATEGGRDHLVLVRKLVKYTETSPFFFPSVDCGDVEVRRSQEGWTRTIFPSVNPENRRDTKLLSCWVQDMIANLELTADDLTLEGDIAEDLAEAAIWIYRTAFDELNRQIATECKDRSDLLRGLWEQYFALNQLRSDIAHENELARAQQKHRQIQEEKKHLTAEKEQVHEQIEKLQTDHLGERKLLNQQKDHLASKLIKSRMDLKDQEQDCHIVTVALKEEVQKRLRTEDELAKTKSLLSKTKQEEIDARSVLKKVQGHHKDLEEKHSLLMSDLHEKQSSLENERLFTKSILKEKCDLEMEYQRIRHEYEANDVIVMGLKEQLRLRDQQLVTMKMSFESNKHRLEDDKNEIEQLQYNVKALEVALTDVRSENEAVMEERRKLELELKEEKVSSQSLIDGLEARIQLLERRLTQSKEECLSRVHELEHVRVELKHTHSNMEVQTQLANTAKTELHHVRSQLTAMATSMGKAAMATGNHLLMNKIDSISSDCPDEEYTSSLSNLLAIEIEASNSPQTLGDGTNFLDVIQLAENQLKDLGAEVAALKQRAALAESLCSCESDTRKKLQAQLQDAKTDRAKALRDCDRSRMRISSLEDELKPMKSLEKKLKSRVTQLENKLQALIPECDQLRADNEKLLPNVAKVARLEVDNCKLQKVVAEKDHEVAASTSRIENLRAEIELSVVEKEELTGRIQENIVNAEQITSLTQDVQELLKERETLFDEVQRLQEENIGFQTACRTTKKQLSLAQFLLKGLNVKTDKTKDTSEDNSLQLDLSAVTCPSDGINSGRSLRARSMSIFGTQDTRMTGSPATQLLRDGSAEFQHLMKQASPSGVHVETISHTGTDSAAAPSKEVLDVPIQKGPSSPQGVASETQEPSVRPAASGTLTNTADEAEPVTTTNISANETKQGHSHVPSDPSQQPRPKLQKYGHSGSRVRFVDQDASESQAEPNKQPDMPHNGYGIRDQPAIAEDVERKSILPNSGPPMPSNRIKRRESKSGRTLSGVLAGYAASGVFELKPRALHFTIPAKEREKVYESKAKPTDAVPGIISQKSLDAHGTKWQNFQISILAWFSRNLRIRLREETRARLRMQIEKCKLEKAFLKSACKREVDILKWVTKSATASRHALRSTESLVREIQVGITSVLEEVGVLKDHTCLIAKGLQKWNKKFDGRKDMATQSTDATVVQWIDFVRKLPKDGPKKPLSQDALLETIVRIYHRKLVKIQKFPRDTISSDSVFEAIEEHYLAQRKKGVVVEAIRSNEGPLTRILLSCRLFQQHPKVRIFASFTGISEDYLPPSAWHFFLMVLDCLRALLSMNWKAAVREWATEKSTLIPIQCVLDLLGNLYNAEQPALLDVMATRLLGMIQMSETGPCIDLDLLMMVIMNEHNSGRCPRNPLKYPRRCTDGSLPNLLNLASTPSANDLPVFDSKASGRVSDIPRSPDIFNNFDAMGRQSSHISLANCNLGSSLARKPSALL